MSSTVKIRRSVGAPAADVPGVALNVSPGDQIEVPTDLAGQPPYWRSVLPGEREWPWLRYRTHESTREVWDLGSGLLAQIGNWEPVIAPRRPRAAAKAGQMDPDPGPEAPKED